MWLTFRSFPLVSRLAIDKPSGTAEMIDARGSMGNERLELAERVRDLRARA